MKNHYGNYVFVTGASSGIGKACAESFAQAGCQVLGVSRNIEEGLRVFENGGRLTCRKMDITDEASIAYVLDQMPRIDICILAAGMGVAGPAEELPRDLVQQQMDVNYIGTVLTGGKILERMRRQGHGLFLVVGSIAGRVSIPMQSHYSSSKFALEAYVDAVRMEMHDYGVKACILEPGDTKTGFTSARRFYTKEGSVYADIARRSVAKMAKDETNGRDPATVARVAMKLAARKNPPARVPIGFEYKLLMFVLRFMPDRLKEWILRLMYLPR